MTVDVIPIKRLPDHLGVFTYRVPEHLAPRISRGVYVRVPFRGQKVWGIVLHAPARSVTSPTRLRDIVDVLETPVLTEGEMRLLERSAALYRTSIATVALHAVVIPPLGATRAQSVVQHGRRECATAEVERHPLLRPGVTVAVWHAHDQRDAAVRSIARAVVACGQSLLCITPHRVRISYLEHLLRGIAPITVLDRTHGRHVLWDAFRRSREGSRVLIGTRAVAWSVPSELGATVIDGAESDDCVQWEADPAYDARRIASWAATERHIPLILLSHAPRVVDWARADHRVDLKDSASPTHAIVDLREYWRRGGRGVITDDARSAIDRVLALGRLAIVLHNRRGLSARITCTDCGHAMTCPRCERPYAEHSDGLRCHRCEVVSPMPVVCPSCQSPRLSGHGIGTAGIARALEREYPGVPIARVDRDTRASIPLPSEARIIVGSERFLHTVAPTLTRPVGAVIIVDAARFVRSDDYRANERLFQALRNVLAWSRAWSAPCVLQSSIVDLPALTALDRPIAAFYRSELDERAALRYPPATRLISATLVAPDALTSVRNHATVERIDGPFPNHSRHTHTAVIRLCGDASDDDVVSVLSAIPQTVRATVDPITLTT